MPLFGAHMSAAGGPDQALHAAARFGMEACQLFTKNNKQWKAPSLTDDTVALFARTLKELGIQSTVSHASYLINLATKNTELWQKSVAALIDEFDRANRLQLDYLVVHPGTASDDDEMGALKLVSAAVDAAMVAIPKRKTMLLLETTAGQGRSIGHTFLQLGTILKHARKGKQVGICLDTCHVFAAGYALSPKSDYEVTIKEFDDAIGLDRLKVLHVNDSVKGLGSRVDRHAALGLGSIGVEGLQNILSDKRFVDLPMILETPKGTATTGEEWDTINMRKIRQFASSYS
jgi:deoxyribonuclease-4